VEVEFLPLYKNQPLFAEIDFFLRSTRLRAAPAFTPSAWLQVDVVGGAKRRRSQRQNQRGADTVYVRDAPKFEKVEPAALLKLAAHAARELIAHTISLRGHSPRTTGRPEAICTRAMQA
jgi:hypothetical protein